MYGSRARSIGLFADVRLDADIDKYKNQVDVLDERVGDLEAVVKELEEWTGELGMCFVCFYGACIDWCVEIKVRRLARR